MPPTPELKAKVTVDQVAFQKGLNDVKKRVAGYAREVASATATGVKYAAELAAAASAGVVLLTEQAFALGHHLQNLHNQTSDAVGELYVMGTAAKSAGQDVGTVASEVAKMSKVISALQDGSTEAQTVMNRLGLTLADLKGKSPIAQLQLIRERLEGIQDADRKLDTAQKIFGRGGAAVLSITAEQLRDAAGFAGDAASVLEKNAEKFHRVQTFIERIPDKLKQFGIGVGAEVADSLEPFLNAFDKSKIVGWGQEFGRAIKYGIDIFRGAFASSQTGELLAASFVYAGTVLLDQLARAVAAFGKGFEEGVLLIARMLGSEAYWAVVVNSFALAANQMASILAGALQDPVVDFISRLRIGMQQAFHGPLNEEGRASIRAQTKGDVGGFFDNFKSDQEDASKKRADAINAAWEDLKKETLDMAGLLDRVKEAYQKGGLSAEVMAKAQADYTALLAKLAAAAPELAKHQDELKTFRLPGTDGAAMDRGLRTGEQYDSLRRIGGALGRTPANHEGVARQQLDVTRGIDRKLADALRWLQTGRTVEAI
ncbi:MAG: hypothetical protein JO317_03100 [Verrucomicrobiae bacterium]|nr:hypothetical protein [Verrucomicrobiae bacterium]